jgi:predicted Fe-S protein YdhL (DUF1289 family)
MSVPSPCVKICRLDASGRVCTGCYRSLAEIAGWLQMDDAARLAALAACERRREGITPG